MNRSVLTKRRVVFCLLWLALGAVTAFGGTEAQTAKDPNAEVERVLKELEEWNRIMGSVEDERAEKQYTQRGGEITAWIKEAAPPNQGNAALLYYQAFLLRPEPNMAVSLKINEIVRGAEPDRQIRIYLGHCLPTIRLVEVASQMPQCSWGIWWGDGLGFDGSDLHSQVSRVGAILAVDAHTLAADGHYLAALARCLTMRRLARHLGSWSPDGLALRTVQHVLGVMPPDADTLAWLRGQLGVVPAVPVSFGESLLSAFESVLHKLRANPGLLGEIRDELVGKAEDEQAKEIARNLTDEQLLSRAREPYERFLDSILRVLDSDITYEQRYAEMQRLTNKLMEEYGSDPAAAQVILWCATDTVIVEQYPRYVGHIAHFNGLRAAVEVYLVVAKTGQLPEKLPDYLPKDPFTGRDFVYEITDEGFALRCQGEDFQKGKRALLEFKVRK